MKNTKKFTVAWPASFRLGWLIHWVVPAAHDGTEGLTGAEMWLEGWDACELSHAGDPPLPVVGWGTSVSPPPRRLYIYWSSALDDHAPIRTEE